MHNAACATGLRNASDGFRGIFQNGGVRNKPIIDIRSALKEGGFDMELTKNRSGYWYRRGKEEVRIMRRNGQWDIRIRNGHGNYLDEFGNVAGNSQNHNIPVFSK